MTAPDFVGYGPRPEPIEWPGDARIADEFAEVRFADVRGPADNLIGELNTG